MRTLIVDDERLARAELRRLLAAHPEIEIAGEAANVPEAIAAVSQLAPDLLLLDVQMPGGSGFDLLEQLPSAPQVIFTTAFDAYTLKAFDVNALDYLLKPIAPERLAAALQRLALPTRSKKPALDRTGRIFLREGERCWFVRIQDIILLESEGNYTRVCFGKDRPLIARSLQTLEDRLDRSMFFRASRKHLVNLTAIEAVEPSVAGGLHVRLKGGFQIEMSRRRAAEFRDGMSL